MSFPAPTATASLDTLPDEARVWVYATDRDLTPDEQEAIVERMRPFFDDWQSHGRRVTGAAAVLYGRFVVLAATLDSGDISGCGIDASVHALEPLGGELGFGFCNPLDVQYRTGEGSIVSVDRLQFKEAAQRGLVNANTEVANPDVRTLGALRKNGLVVRAGDSWHARAFDLN